MHISFLMLPNIFNFIKKLKGSPNGSKWSWRGVRIVLKRLTQPQLELKLSSMEVFEVFNWSIYYFPGWVGGWVALISENKKNSALVWVELSWGLAWQYQIYLCFLATKVLIVQTTSRPRSLASLPLNSSVIKCNLLFQFYHLQRTWSNILSSHHRMDKPHNPQFSNWVF